MRDNRLIQPFARANSYRGLLYRLLERDIKAIFRGSALGALWVVVAPLVLLAFYSFIFGVVIESHWVNSEAKRFEVPLIFYGGLIVFMYFMECLTRAPSLIRENRMYVTKVVFPVDLLSWMVVGSATFRLLINLAILTLFLLVVQRSIPFEIIGVIMVLLPLAVLMLGVVWIVSAIGVFIRDLSHAIAALAPVFMFISPIFYSVDQVPAPFDTLYYLNPLTYVLETIRSLLFFDGRIELVPYLAYWLAALIVCLFGHHLFSRLKPRFADVL